MTTAASSWQPLAEVIDSELRARGSSVRATRERTYLKSDLVHYGVGVPETRAIVRTALRGADLDHDGAIELAEILWNAVGGRDVGGRDVGGCEAGGRDVGGRGVGGREAGGREVGGRDMGGREAGGHGVGKHDGDRSGHSEPEVHGRAAPVHERRSAATMVLIQTKDHLGAGDSEFLERLLRQARTWALVDPLAGDAVGPLAEHDAKFAPVLERWSVDEDFWIRRSALLAHLRPLREGRGDFERFARFADGMLEEKEFFIRKAIGWVLRDTARKRPEMVFTWVSPRAHRTSGVTMREVVKHLSPGQREELLAARNDNACCPTEET